MDGSPFAQILYVRSVPTGPRDVPGGPHHKVLFKNLFIVATSTNWLYAFDAANTATDPNTPAVWKQNFGPTRMLC